jgi:hypothetical protein
MRVGVFCLLLVAGALCLAGVTGAAGTASFLDNAADGGLAPDVTAVTVSNDDQGLVTFRVTVGNRTALGPDDVIAIPFATDDADIFKGLREDGVNFILVLDGTSGPSLLRWNGNDMDEVSPQPASVSGSFADGVATLTVRQEDLAPGFPDLSVPIQFSFYVLGIAFSGTDVVAQDEAPDGSELWSYRLSQPLRVIVTNFDADKTVKAGKTLIVLMGAAHGDTGAAVKAGRITCRARLGSKTLAGRGSFVTVTVKSPLTGKSILSPNAACSWKVPKKAKGTTIRGSMTLTESGVANNRSFSTRVR